MGGKRDEIEPALALLKTSVVERLSAAGWVGRDLTGGSVVAVIRTVATMTRTGDNGVLVAVELAIPRAAQAGERPAH
jgi:hypothetical protein